MESSVFNKVITAITKKEKSKIDGSIIKNIDKESSAYNIVKTIVVFAKSMNMKIVAEQVETQGELKTVSELEIDCLQGYAIARPSFEFVTQP